MQSLKNIVQFSFAVVADEVRALAERTTRATKEISDMIASIQKETGAAIRSMEEGVKGTEQGVVEAAQLETALPSMKLRLPPTEFLSRQKNCAAWLNSSGCSPTKREQAMGDRLKFVRSKYFYIPAIAILLISLVIPATNSVADQETGLTLTDAE